MHADREGPDVADDAVVAVGGEFADDCHDLFLPVCSGRAHRGLDDGVRTGGDRHRTPRGRN
ncbi:hypothetical protein, partial [Brucella endophytica]|uniref:hypothetical protein n=1 Tax=Brucella endophytica TaxID=1963359 RepID=UPI0035BC6D90